MNPSTDLDQRDLLRRALDQTEALIAGTDPADAGRPTPCTEYDVNQLIGHLIGVQRRITAVLSGGHPFSVPVVVPSDDWIADWAATRPDAEAVLADDAVLDRQVNVPWGTLPGAAAMASYVGELATHDWDLAVATGGTAELDDELATASLPAQQAKIPPGPRENLPFAPAVEVPDDAAPYDRLVAWSGRDPGWRPPA